MEKPKGMSKVMIIILVVVVVIVAAAVIWMVTQNKTNSNTNTTTTNQNTNTVNLNSNINTPVNTNLNSNVNSAVNTNSNTNASADAAIDTGAVTNVYDTSTIKKGDKVGLMTADVITKDSIGNYTVQFTGQAVITGWISYQGPDNGAQSDKVCVGGLSETSSLLLPRDTMKDDAYFKTICFSNTAEAKVAFPANSASKRAAVLMDSYTDTTKDDEIDTGRFVRLSSYDETANWRTYTNSTLNFTMKFPPSWDGYTVTTIDANTVKFTNPKKVSDKGNPGEVSFTIYKLPRFTKGPAGYDTIDTFDGFDYDYVTGNAAMPDELLQLNNVILDIINTFKYTK